MWSEHARGPSPRPIFPSLLLLYRSVHSVLGGRPSRRGTRAHVDERHRDQLSDIAATAKLEGRDARIYVLVKHKSYRDPSALLQIIRYMVQAWSRDVGRTQAENPRFRGIELYLFNTVELTFDELPDAMGQLMERPELKV